MTDVDPFKDPVAFMRFFRNPQTGEPLAEIPAQQVFLRELFRLTPDGRLRYSDAIFSGPKKSTKTTTAAICVLYVILALAGPYGEAIIVANDEEQAISRVFEACVRLIKTNRALQDEVKITERKITFLKTGATITALASDFAGAAGGNQNIVCADEIWGFSQESAARMFDELVPVPTQKISLRLVTTYAGYSGGESKLLEDHYRRGLRGTEIAPSLYSQPGMLMAWHHEPIAPWQTAEWIASMKTSLRPTAFTRMVLNQFASAESEFIPVAWWDRAAVAQPILADRSRSVWVGVDASLKRDQAAVVACGWEDGKVRIVGHRLFKPGKDETLDLEETLEAAVLDFAQRFRVKAVRFDPWQFQRSAQTLSKRGINMVELPQSIPNLTSMSTNLYEVMKADALLAYPDPDFRLAIQHAVAVETSRGLKITKEKASHKIDVLVALAIAALGAVQKPQTTTNIDPAAFAGLLTRTIHRPEVARGGEYLGPNSTQPTAPSKWR